MSKPVGPYTPRRPGRRLAGRVRPGRAWSTAPGRRRRPRQTPPGPRQPGRLLLEAEGASLDDVVKTTVFLRHIGDYAAMNEAYIAAFGDHRPARSAVAVADLPLGALVEIEGWAYLA